MKFIFLTCIILCCFNAIKAFPIYPQTFDLGDRIMYIVPKHHPQHTESCFQDISEEEEAFEEFMASFYDDPREEQDLYPMYGWSRLFKDVYSYLIGFLNTRNHQFYI